MKTGRVGKQRSNPTSYGTSYFVSRGAAERYYRDYEDDAKRAVARKVAAGEIHIGKPPLKAGQRLTTTDGGKRYMIIEGNTRQRNAARHTTCRYCQLDIEGFSPYRKCEWRDRGNNTHCNDGKHCHAPYIERRTRRNPELALPSNKFVNAKVRMKGGKIQVMADERVLGKAGFKAGAGLSGVSVSGGAKLNPKRKRKCANCGHSAASHEDGSGSLGRCYHGSSRGDQCDCRKYE
jgi:hypothetical protein